MLHCFSSMSRNNTENWFEHNKATFTCSMTRVDSQCNTTGDCVYPGNPPPDFHPQDSSCKIAEIRLAGAWGEHAVWPQPSCRGFPAESQRTARSFISTKLHSERSEVTLVLPPSHLTKAEQHTMLRCQGWTDTHKHTQTTELFGVNSRQASTHTLCAVGIAHSDKERGGDCCTVASSCLWRLSDWSAEQSPALTSPKAILQFC